MNLQEQPQEQSQDMGMMMPHQPDTSQTDFQLHKWLMDITILTSNIKEKLEGKYWAYDKDAGTYVQKETKPLMNIEGINACMSKIETYCGPNFQFSYFTQDQVNRIMDSLAYEINLEIACNYFKYGIQREDVDGVSSLILNSVWASLMKAVDGKLMKHIQNIATLQQVHHSSQGPSRMGGGGSTDVGAKRKWFGLF